MDIIALRAELTGDPLGVGYAGMSDAAAAASLNSETREQARPVAVGEMLTILRERGRWLAIKVSPHPAAEAARDLFEGAAIVPDVSVQSPAMQAGLGALVASGLISQVDRDAIEALGVTRSSRARELGLIGRSTEVGPAHVAKARA